ncbi:hypothetical protein AB0A74_37445 [Saccharothrix sp. NPDC042600]|uniref:hypothetical protein n=1 Tax=Saccharothrix TaxID=2071 RepID=UPI003402FC81|nr:hypothetical protein GCM10017745_60040 [Saccharothrix mutabilis subsp. capreolus]
MPRATLLDAEPVPDVAAVRAEFDALIAAVWDDPAPAPPPAARPARPPGPEPDTPAPVPPTREVVPGADLARQRSPPRAGRPIAPGLRYAAGRA